MSAKLFAEQSFLELRKRFSVLCTYFGRELCGGPRSPLAPKIITDRRLFPARPFDDTPRRRSDDIGLLIQEYAGTPALFICRDGKTQAVVQRIDYMADWHPVKGYVRIERDNGLVLTLDCDWMLEGAQGLRSHNWDIVGLFDPEEPEIEA